MEESTSDANALALTGSDRRRAWVIGAAAFAAWTALSLWSEVDARAVRDACTAASIADNAIYDCAPSDRSTVIFFSLFAAIPFLAGWSCARYLRARPFLSSALIAGVGSTACLFSGVLATPRQYWDAALPDLVRALSYVCFLSVAISLLGVFVGRRFRRNVVPT